MEILSNIVSYLHDALLPQGHFQSYMGLVLVLFCMLQVHNICVKILFWCSQRDVAAKSTAGQACKLLGRKFIGQATIMLDATTA